MDIEQFPKKETVLKSIEKLKKMSFTKFIEGDDVSTFVNLILEILSNEFGPKLNAKLPYNTNKFLSKFFRVREWESFTNINLIREHSYPPLDYVKMNRCNFPRFPVFYCSIDPMTALLEVVRDFNGSEKIYCISKWELFLTNENMVFESFLQTDLPKDNQFAETRDRIREQICSSFSLNKEQEEGLIEYLKYLDNSFINDDDYSLSATLAHIALYNNDNYRTDVLMYPSVQTVFNGINFAIQPNFVENNMKLTRLYILNFEKFNPKNRKISLTFLEYAEVEKNRVVWKNIKQNDEHHNLSNLFLFPESSLLLVCHNLRIPKDDILLFF